MSEQNLWVTLDGTQGKPGSGKHIVLISGDEEYRSEQAMAMLGQVLATHHGFRCSVLFAIDPATGLVDPNVLDNIPGMHLLDSADMCVFFVRFRELPDDDMKHFVDYVFGGKPLLGIRTSTHAFQYKKNQASPYAKFSCDNKDESYIGGFGKQVLGEQWAGHHGDHGSEATRGVAHPSAAGHPILRGVGEPFGPSDVYVAHPPGDAQVIMDGQVLVGMNPADAVNTSKPTMPLVWLRQPNAETGAGRIMCSTMGAANDLADVSLRRLMVNGCYWGMGMEDAIVADSCVDPVGEYWPENFGVRRAYSQKPLSHFFS